MHRQPLLNLLQRYHAFDPHENEMLEKICLFVSAFENCFERSLAIGHLTGSAWIIDETGTKVLLTHHRKLDRWIQLGGHADGENDLFAVALREAREESGIEEIVPVRTEIFDVDIHAIPARPETPAHDHYDIRFLFKTSSGFPLVVSHESKSLEWVLLEEIETKTSDMSVLRLANKTKAFNQSGFNPLSCLSTGK